MARYRPYQKGERYFICIDPEWNKGGIFVKNPSSYETEELGIMFDPFTDAMCDVHWEDVIEVSLEDFQIAFNYLHYGDIEKAYQFGLFCKEKGENNDTSSNS